MNLDDVDPALHAALARIPAVDPSRPVVRLLMRLATRLMPGHRVDGVTTTWLRDGAVHVRVYRPDGVSSGRGLLWVHGGGLVIGSPKQDDRLCAGTAAQLGITVVSVRYRLAPDAPFPAAHDDVAAAWGWLQANAASVGVDPLRVAIGGESAGGGIAAGVVQRVRDAGGVQPIAQWLFAPMLDDRTAARRELDAVDHFVWNNRANRFGWAAYLGSEPGATSVPAYAAPARRTDLTGLPPTWLCAGDIELFRDEVVVYADRLRADGVDVTYLEVPGGAHGFENWAATAEPTTRLLTAARNWLGERLGVVPVPTEGTKAE